MSKPFHYKPLSEVIAEYEKDPEKKKLLDAEREKRLAEFLSYSGTEINVKEYLIDCSNPYLAALCASHIRKKQLAQDIDEAGAQDEYV